MIRNYTQEILKHISGQRAYETVAEVSTFHRIQASTGFRAAAHHCKDKLKRWGFENAEVLSYPAREDVIFGTYPSFKEWDCKAAWCDLVSPEERRLADFDAYCFTHHKVLKDYENRAAWAKRSLYNIAFSGRFAADRAINQYASDIWHINPVGR